MSKFWGKMKENWVLPALLLITFVFFWKFFIKGMVPIPSDIISGVYLPWFDLRFASFPSGIPVRNNILSDVVSVTYPYRKLAIDLMKSGQAPLWNPFILSGNVLLANFQSVALYPLNIIYWIVADFSKAWSLQIISQPILAGVFMYLFLKNNKLSNLPSLLGSAVWAFSGFFSVWLEYNTLVHASLYFPLILYCIQKGLENGRYCLLMSLAISMSFYAGYPQITLYELLFAFLFIKVIYPEVGIRKLLIFLFYVLLGVGLSLPLLIPGFEAAGLSIRQVDNVARLSNVKFALPQQIITFIAPDFFGSPVTRNYWLIGGTYENAVVFVGGPAFLLFLYSFWIRFKKNTRLLFYSRIVFFISVLLIFKNPISEYLGNLNIFSLSSFVMGRLAVMMTFGIAVSSSLALEEMIRNKIRLKNFRYPIAILYLFLLVPALIAFFKLSVSDSCEWCLVGLRNLILPALTATAAAALIFILSRMGKQRIRIILLTGLVLLEIFALYYFHNKYNTFSQPEFLYPETNFTNFLKSQEGARFERDGGGIIPSNMWMPYGLFSASGQDAVHSLRYNKFISFVNVGNFEPTDRYVEITNLESPLVDFLGIKNIAAIKWKNAIPDFEGTTSYRLKNSKFKEVFNEGRTLILENTKAYPRIFSVGGYVLANTDSDFGKLLNSINLSKSVILEENPEIIPGASKATISNQKFKALSTSARVESSQNTLLVFTQSFFPGWKAYVDGKKSPLYRADYTFMAVAVPAGAHTVEVKYQPTSFYLGLSGGGISIICFVLCYFFLRKPYRLG